MYGLINKTIGDFVTARLGAEAWGPICRAANVDSDFAAMEYYPDDVSSRLLECASAALGLSLGDGLEEFGRFFVLHVTHHGYKDLLMGHSFFENLSNLDAMHARIARSFPKLRPPSFKCTQIAADHYSLRYFSSREGLDRFVVGLVKGLAETHGNIVTVVRINAETDERAHVEFEIRVRRTP